MRRLDVRRQIGSQDLLGLLVGHQQDLPGSIFSRSSTCRRSLAASCIFFGLIGLPRRSVPVIDCRENVLLVTCQTSALRGTANRSTGHVLAEDPPVEVDRAGAVQGEHRASPWPAAACDTALTNTRGWRSISPSTMTLASGSNQTVLSRVARLRQLAPDLAEQPQHLQDLARLDGIEDAGDRLVGHAAVEHGLRFLAGREMR